MRHGKKEAVTVMWRKKGERRADREEGRGGEECEEGERQGRLSNTVYLYSSPWQLCVCIYLCDSFKSADKQKIVFKMR